MSEDIEDVDGNMSGIGGANVGSDPIVDRDVEGAVAPNIGTQLPDNSNKRKRASAFTVVGLLVGIVVLALILTLVVFEPHQKTTNNAAEAGDDGDVLDDGGDVMIPDDNDGIIMDDGSGDSTTILDDTTEDESSPTKIWPNDFSDIDIDPNLTYGQLENGFRYMIYPHNDPEYEISMQMHVNVGSLHEDTDQLG